MTTPTQWESIIEQRRMEIPVCWKCEGTRFIEFSATRDGKDLNLNLVICRGCSRIYRLNQPYLRLVKESPNQEALDYLAVRRSIRLKLIHVIWNVSEWFGVGPPRWTLGLAIWIISDILKSSKKEDKDDDTIQGDR